MDVSEKAVNILWTGGWDSSYRIVELSRKNTIIQPLYVYGEGRPSENYEIRAMQNILKKLNKKNETKAQILPVNFIHFENIEVDKSISKAYDSIAQEIHLGTQYEWLASLALNYNYLEIGIEKAPPEQSGAINAIQTYGKIKYNKKRDTYLLDRESSSNDLNLLFQNLSFPIIEKTGDDMKKNITRWGYEAVMKDTWMCFTPIFGKPCGVCTPCQSKMETNMDIMLPPSSKRRYRNRNKKLSKQKNRILRRVSSFIDKIRFRKYSIEKQSYPK